MKRARAYCSSPRNPPPRTNPAPRTCTRSAASRTYCRCSSSRRHGESAGRGRQRARIEGVTDARTHYVANAIPVTQEGVESTEVEAMRRALVAQFDQYVKLNKKIPPEILTSLAGIDEGGRLADTIAAQPAAETRAEAAGAGMFDVKARLEHLLSQLEGEIDILQVEKRIRGRVKRQMEKSQREYYLNEQVKAIQKELGRGGRRRPGGHGETVKAARHAKEARKKAEGELKKLRLMSRCRRGHGGAQLHRKRWSTCVGKKRSKISRDIAPPRSLGYGPLRPEKVKERIVRVSGGAERVDQLKAPILCLVGLPGGQDVAGADDRARDQPQVRAHVLRRRARRGRDPRPPAHVHRFHAGEDPAEHDKVGVRNPLCSCSTRVDKMGMDFRGDPSSALLEVLDPEQNHTFTTITSRSSTTCPK